MRITITCEECGRRHRLERSVDQPGAIWIVCHDCELPLRAVLEDQPESLTVAAGPTEHFRAAWAGTLDLSRGSAAAS